MRYMCNKMFALAGCFQAEKEGSFILANCIRVDDLWSVERIGKVIERYSIGLSVYSNCQLESGFSRTKEAFQYMN